jgi:hypothetical protein
METNVLLLERQVTALSHRLQDTIDTFKKANTDLILPEYKNEMVAILKEDYYAMLDICNTSLDDLHTMQKAFGAAATAAIVAQQEKKRNISVTKLRFKLVKQLVKAR